jgi:cadmium resistance protein CadD (predicted permease)
MIVTALLDLVRLIVSAMVYLLPAVELPFKAQMLATAGWISKALYQFSHFLPVADFFHVVRFVGIVWLPGYLVFIIARFIWAHVPIIGSGG